MKKADIAAFFDRLAAEIPIPKGELEYINPYTLLVAVVLSAQATDVSVNKATRPLFEKVKTPEAMLALGEAKLKGYIKTIGLYNSKAKNVIALSRILTEQHGGQVPASREVLETLPGVGRKTANVVRRRWRSKRSSKRSCPRHARCTPTTGSSCTGAMSARRASPIARPAWCASSAPTRPRRLWRPPRLPNPRPRRASGPDGERPLC
jgi:hypothetical protein